MFKWFKRKKKKDQYSVLLIGVLSFYLLMSLFMTIAGNLTFIRFSHTMVYNTSIADEFVKKQMSLMVYSGFSFVIGSIIFLGTISGIIGLIKKHMSLLIFAITVIVFSHFVFVLMDGYFSALYGVFDLAGYTINVIALLSGFYLLIKGYQDQEKLLK